MALSPTAPFPTRERFSSVALRCRSAAAVSARLFDVLIPTVYRYHTHHIKELLLLANEMSLQPMITTHAPKLQNIGC